MISTSKKNIIQLFVTISSITSAYFISLLSTDDLDIWLIVTILTALSIIIWIINIFIESYGKYDFEHKIEGIWIQKHIRIDNVQTYCLVEIEVNEITGISLKGTVYSKEGQFIAQWDGKDVGVNVNEKSLFYIYDGNYSEDQLAGNGYGKTQFSKSNLKYISKGKGFFQDSKSCHHPINHIMERIDDNLCNDLIKKKKLQKTRDYETFVKEYHKYINN